MPTLKARRNAVKRPYLALPEGCESASFFLGGYDSVVVRPFDASGTGFRATRCRSSDVVMMRDKTVCADTIQRVSSQQWGGKI